MRKNDLVAYDDVCFPFTEEENTWVKCKFGQDADFTPIVNDMNPPVVTAWAEYDDDHEEYDYVENILGAQKKDGK